LQRRASGTRGKENKMALDYTILTKDTAGAPELIGAFSSHDEAVEILRDFRDFGIADAAAKVGARIFENKIGQAIESLHAQYRRSRIGDRLKVEVTFAGVTIWIVAR
jgi:hypothetical protein